MLRLNLDLSGVVGFKVTTFGVHTSGENNKPSTPIPVNKISSNTKFGN